MLPFYDAAAVAEALGLCVGGPLVDHAERPSAMTIERAVESGLPRGSLRHVATLIAGDDRAGAVGLATSVAPISSPDLLDTMSLVESERTERVARLFVQAQRTLGTLNEARSFMVTPHPELDGRRPVDAAKTDLGTRRTERILVSLEYGLAL